MNFKFFYNVYKSIDESIRKSYIIDIHTNESGFVNVSIGTEYREDGCENPYFSLEKIKTTPLLFDSLCIRDQRLVDALILAEGDLIVKNYDYESEKFELASMLYSSDVYCLTRSNIIEDQYIINRINKQHLKMVYDHS